MKAGLGWRAPWNRRRRGPLAPEPAPPWRCCALIAPLVGRNRIATGSRRGEAAATGPPLIGAERTAGVSAAPRGPSPSQIRVKSNPSQLRTRMVRRASRGPSSPPSTRTFTHATHTDAHTGTDTHASAPSHSFRIRVNSESNPSQLRRLERAFPLGPRPQPARGDGAARGDGSAYRTAAGLLCTEQTLRRPVAAVCSAPNRRRRQSLPSVRT